MGAGKTIRRHIVGIDSDISRKEILRAMGLFVLSSVYIISHHLLAVPQNTYGLYFFIVTGVVLAGVSAYRNSGLLISWLLVLAPVSVPLLYTEYLIATEGSVPIALFLTLVGARAAGFWIPTAFVLGGFAFALGVALQWAEEW